jgi:thioredoxin reductase (NADPH)
VAGLEEYEGMSVFYAAGPPEGQLCTAQRVGVVGGGNSAAQAAVWLARGGALVTLLHRRGDLRETMSQYLIDELDRYGVAVRDRSEIAGLLGEHGRLRSVTLAGGEQLPFSFLFLGATPCTEWLGDALARDGDGFILTGADVGAEGLLETSMPGVYAAGDVRAGSTKRCVRPQSARALPWSSSYTSVWPVRPLDRVSKNRRQPRRERAPLTVAERKVAAQRGAIGRKSRVAIDLV